MTHWKKNIDTRYISGEDLISGLKGLQKEMVVKLSSFQDGETFDQKKQTKETRTILFFSDSKDKALYKGVVLNATNAKFFEKEMESTEMEDWSKKAVTMYAKQDNRHGHVVRFKRYEKPHLKEGTQSWTAVLAHVQKGNDPAKAREKYQISDVLFKKLEDARTKPTA